MKLAYLLGTYPLPSETFVRKEIESVEALGQPVERLAARCWENQVVDPRDIEEQARTDYLVTGGKGRLLGDALTTLLRHPLRSLAMTGPLWRLYRNAGKRLPTHLVYALEALAFRTRAARLGISHVHCHFSNNATAIAMLAHTLGGPRYSFTVHGPDELIDPGARSLGMKARGAAFVVAITQYCRGRILAEAPDVEAKVHVIHCGIDPDDFAFDGAAPDTSRIVCVGRLCFNKGQRHIPAAVAQVKDEFPDLVIDLLGGGDDEALIRSEIAEYGVEKQVILHGWATGAQVRETLRESRALLLPSYAEGLPIVIMEALAVGRPVLTTRITGIPELVDSECGWLFEPGDVQAIAEALRGVMRASAAERAAMGAEGRRRVEERHDLRKSAAALLDEFKSTVSAD
jgi:glycosyltransferase involved in cell wall biosynthesis